MTLCHINFCVCKLAPFQEGEISICYDQGDHVWEEKMEAPTRQDSRTAGLSRTVPGKPGCRCHIDGVLSCPPMPHQDAGSRRHGACKSPQAGATPIPIRLGCMQKSCIHPRKCVPGSVQEGISELDLRAATKCVSHSGDGKKVKAPETTRSISSGNRNRDARPTAAVNCSQLGSAADAHNVRRIYDHGEKKK